MTGNDQAVQARAAERPVRRVGTFTLGMVLVCGGGIMLASLLWPKMPVEWVVRLMPCILIALGVEVLLAVKSGSRVKYDGMGMFLCFLLTIFALGLYGVSYWMLEGPGIPVYDGRWSGSENGLEISYNYFNRYNAHYMELEEGDVLEMKGGSVSGWLDVSVVSLDDGKTLFSESFLESGSYSVDIPSDGSYLIELVGHKAAGYARFRRIPAEEPEAPEAGDSEGVSGAGETSEIAP